ncbi:MAG: dihydropteroate synthase [Acetobacteraceae bacterium]|nr:dihydropteroate synthase [Acetobacteraceae bacterium]
MGIVNVTPDSFSDGGRTPSQAVDLGLEMLDDGAAIIDVGGESTRPGATPVSPDEEQRRVLPVIEALARRGAMVSVDTRHASTMVRAAQSGARIINDVSGLTFDAKAVETVASLACPVVIMHMRGTPETMNSLAHYADVTTEVYAELTDRVNAAVRAGVARERVAVDPGFGFAKNAQQSADLLRNLALFVNLRCPIIAGLSRKRFVGALAGVDLAAERDAASIAAGLFAVERGASVLRVHNVRATVHALRVWTELNRVTEPVSERSS